MNKHTFKVKGYNFGRQMKCLKRRASLCDSFVQFEVVLIFCIVIIIIIFLSSFKLFLFPWQLANVHHWNLGISMPWGSLRWISKIRFRSFQAANS